MTPKEKAWDLTLEFRFRIDSYFQPEEWGMVDYHNIQLKKAAKDCAILSVEEILDEIQPFELGYKYEYKIEFWNNVKKEIEAL